MILLSVILSSNIDTDKNNSMQSDLIDMYGKFIRIIIFKIFSYCLISDSEF